MPVDYIWGVLVEAVSDLSPLEQALKLARRKKRIEGRLGRAQSRAEQQQGES